MIPVSESAVDVSAIRNPLLNPADNMREQLLYHTIVLFARKGVAKVTVREITEACGVTSGNLYNHYKSKDELFHTITGYVDALVDDYTEQLSKQADKAKSLQEVLDIVFSVIKDPSNEYAFYCISLLQTEQFRDQVAYDIYINRILPKAIAAVRSRLDWCFEKGFIRKCDTLACAMIFVSTIMTTITMSAHQCLGDTRPMQTEEIINQIHTAFHQLLCATK